MKYMIFAFASLAAAVGSAVGVSDVVVRDGDRGLTEITYKLTGTEPAIVTMEVFTNGVSTGAAGTRHAVGDVWKLVAPDSAERKIHWRADRDLDAETFASGRFDVKLTAWATNMPPDYMVVDLVTTNTVYYPSVDHLPAGGLVHSRAYAQSFWVFRKIHAALKTFRLGDHTGAYQRDVLLTHDFYIAVYELTDGQLQRMESGTYGSAYPKSNNYNGWRGSAYRWPLNGHQVKEDSPIDRYRRFTGLEIDMPTEAQWEIAARAGEDQHSLYNGKDLVTSTDSLGHTVAPMLDEIAWAGWNSTNAAGELVAFEVGLKKPNAWGLYDMLGGYWEWCLEYNWSAPTYPTVDPTCAPSSTLENASPFCRRGGAYNVSPAYSTLTSRTTISGTWTNDGMGSVDGSGTRNTHGFRAVCPAVAVK